MAQLSFENVGIIATVRQTVNATNEPTTRIPIGVKTPLKLADGSLFEMNFTYKEQIADNLKNLILTNFGDRVGNVTFGANLTSLLEDFTSIEEFNSNAMTRIKTATTKWMPYIDLVGYESYPFFENGFFKERIKLIISYRVPLIPELAKATSLLEVELRIL